MVARVCAFLLLADASLALRRNSKKAAWPWSNKGEKVACPVMAALVNEGVLTLDSKGRATQEDTLRSLMWMGNTPVMSGFQAKGIAAFKDNDTHQAYRERAPGYKGTLYLNYNTWNPYSECVGGFGNTRDGMACNLNIGFQQHGYSTTIRDPTDGSSAKTRWAQWMNLPGVLTNIAGVREKVMTIEGLGALLKAARLNGDKNGEFALTARNTFAGSQLAFYHPTAKTPQQYKPCSQWQAIGAWAAFWAVFERRSSNGVWYMPESDLRRFFFDGKFPKDYSPKPWGFKETMKAVRKLKGTGAGEEWCAAISGVIAQVGEEAPDEHFAGGLLGLLSKFGARADDKFRTAPRR